MYSKLVLIVLEQIRHKHLDSLHLVPDGAKKSKSTVKGRIFNPFLLQAGRPSIFFLKGEFVKISESMKGLFPRA